VTVTSLQMRLVLTDCMCGDLVLFEVAPNLHHLSVACQDVNSVPNNQHIGDYSVDPDIVELLSYCTNLCTLEISGMSDGSITKLARALQAPDFLTRLSTLALESTGVGQTGLEDEEAEELAKTLSGNTSLTALTLSNHRVGFSGARALSDSLANNTTLKSLNMSSNFQECCDT